MSKVLTIVKNLIKLALLFISTMAYAGPIDLPAKVFLISNSEGNSCSVTLLKTQDHSCHLVTNAHCIPESNQNKDISIQPLNAKITISASVKDVFGQLSATLKTQLKKVNPKKDLAELVLPSALNDYCQDILPTDLMSALNIDSTLNNKSELSSFSSLGFHSGLPVTSFTQHLDWKDGMGLESLFRIDTSLPELEYLYNLRSLQMFNGMSGGPTINQKFSIVGINIRLVAFQDQMEIIPIKEVLKFLQENKSNPGSNPGAGNNNSLNAGENSSGNGGENSAGNGGENSSGNGHDNSQIIDQNSILKFLREADEGVDIRQPNGSFKRLLALGPYQIDGQDDFRRYSDKNLAPLYRDGDEFKKVQADLFKRIEGSYTISPDSPFSTNVLLVKTKDHWKTTMIGQTGIQVKVKRVSRTKALISLFVFEFNMSQIPDKENNIKIAVPARHEDYTAKMSENSQVIELHSSTGQILQCQNQYFLKLICSSAPPFMPEEFSISLSMNSKSEAKLRQSKFSLNSEIEYLYGTLLRTP